ncbi:hypothetical protein Bpfe_022468 [Biomphalaria pfeifferi]|uniref:Uncharacterized protein n=1 Tax=Biomphalaria pfeifferi TaxID=112525 RepID=A0AAD8B563_BIOPF|nr:hypothetical protein Bpfe_022468 [Biomphalaria pfeifferi]
MNLQTTRTVIRTLWKEYLEGTFKLNLKVNDSPRFVTYTNPGLNYFHDYDRNGSPDLVRLMLYSVNAETFADRYPGLQEDGEMCSYIYWDKLLHDRTSFVASTEFTFSRTMYDETVAKWPLNVKVSFGGMGSTSVQTRLQICTQHSSEPVITKVLKLVTVDRQTRRPMALPDWYKKKLQGKEDKMPDFKFTGFKRPERTYVRRVQIVWSDTDSNNHTNFSSYVQFGLDTLRLALLQMDLSTCQKIESPNLAHSVTDTEGSKTKTLTEMVSAANCNCDVQSNVSAIPWMTKDLLTNGVKNLKICYMRESVEGDMLDVHVWQEPGEEFKVRGSIEALDGKAICQYIIEYFTPTAHL